MKLGEYSGRMGSKSDSTTIKCSGCGRETTSRLLGFGNFLKSFGWKKIDDGWYCFSCAFTKEHKSPWD